MTTHNDITGDAIKTKSNSSSYVSNWEKIFGKVLLSEYFTEDGSSSAKIYLKSGKYLVEYKSTVTEFDSKQEAEDFAESLVGEFND